MAAAAQPETPAVPAAPVQQAEGVKKAKIELVDKVLNKVESYTSGGAFLLPKDYAVENHVRAAFFIIGETVDRNKAPALDVCTEASVAEALFRMVMQGLDPVKQQCYFIVNGNKLSLRRSYQGSIAVAKRVAQLDDCPAVVVHKGDVFEFETVNGYRKVTLHKTTLESLDSEIIGCYAIATFLNGRAAFTDIMTMKQIRTSWKMSQNRNGNKLQDDFSDEAAKRTVINRALKPVINTSSDANLYQKKDEDEEDNDVQDTTFETMESNKLPEKKVVAIGAAVPKQTVPVATAQPEPARAVQRTAPPKAETAKVEKAVPDTLFEANEPTVYDEPDPEVDREEEEGDMGDNPDKW